MSVFGIVTHAQRQTIDGRAVVFQPEHLLCDECWRSADSGYSHAVLFGSCFATSRNGWNDTSGHGIHVEVTK